MPSLAQTHPRAPGRTGDALRATLLVGVLAAAVPHPVVAEEPMPTPGAELLLFQEPVVTGAAKHEQTATDAPSWVSVITHEDIQRFGYRTLAEALRSVAGFFGSSDRNYDYVGVRGFLRPTDFNDRFLLLVNGHTYNNDVYQQAALGNDFGIDLESVKRIEVIRGPGAALYGGSAFFAVVNVVTEEAPEAPGVHVLAETGSFVRKRGRGRIGHVFGNGLEVYAAGSVLDVDGPENLFYPEYASPKTHYGIAHDVDGEQAIASFLSARYGNLSFQGGYNRREKHIPTGSYGTAFNDPDNRTIDSRWFADLTFRRAVTPSLTVMARGYYDGFLYDGTYVYYADGLRVPNRDLADSQWFGTELQARWQAFPGNSLTAGAELTYHPSATQENFDAPSGLLYLADHRSFESWGVYLQDEWTLLPSLDLVAGLRFDSFYERLRELSPRAAILWRPIAGTSVKLLYGEAFRPPNLYEQFYSVPLGVPASLPNPDLDSEKIRTYEAVLEQTLPRRARATIAFYRYRIHGLIDNVAVSGGAATQYQNLEGAEARGAEFELRIPLPGRVELRTSYALQDARTDEGRLLSNSPKHLGQAGLLFPLPVSFEGGVQLVVVGPRRTLAGRSLDTAHTLNLTLRSPPLHGFRLSGSVYNLLDQAYFDPGGQEFRQDRIRQDGVTFRVQLGYAF